MFRIKKITVFIILISILAFTSFETLAQTTVNQDKPSDWAVPEVTDAIEKELVPAELQSNYQTNIKRYQYVLLALKVFDKTGKSVDIIEAQPFSDSINHEYANEIVKAYNAGIVKGDGKGNFFPDNYITRQEIASLVVNLLMQIAPDKDFTVKNKYEYSDGNEISDWARFYIDYCFENKILAGYGNNVIDPKGNATIEQSIALLYRLAKNEGLLEKPEEQTDGPVNLEEISADTINNFISEYNKETIDIIKRVTENDEVEISSFWDKSATLAFEQNTLSISSTDFEKNIYAFIHDANDELFFETYKELLLSNFSGGEKGVLILEQNIGKIKSKEFLDIYEKIDETQVFIIEAMKDDTDSIMDYQICFLQRKK